MKGLVSIVIILCAVIIPTYGQTMEWHIRGDYVEIEYMGNHLFKVKTSTNKWGIINEYGHLSVETKFDSITPFVEGRSLLLDYTGRFLKGIINEKGQMIKSFNNDELVANYPYYSEGLLAYGVVEGSQYRFGYLDIHGNKCIDTKYYWAAPFCEGKAVVHHTSGNYGIIDKTGRSILVDNRNFNFISSLDNNTMLVAYASNRGGKVELSRLEPNGRLTTLRVIEQNGTISRASDYKSIRSRASGTTYYFDDAMRLVSSSLGNEYNSPISPVKGTTFSSSILGSQLSPQGWMITYNGAVLLQHPFLSVECCSDEYAIVSDQFHRKSVLKLNRMGKLWIQEFPSELVYHHNKPQKAAIIVGVEGIHPETVISMKIKGIEGAEDMHIPAGYTGLYKQDISYFIPSTKLNSIVSLPIQIEMYIGGMMYQETNYVLTGKHEKGFRLPSYKEVLSPEFTDAEGKATIVFDVESIGVPSSSARVSVSGDLSSKSRYFEGNNRLSYSFDVVVPEDEQKTFSFKIAVKEKGCPTQEVTITKTIKNYFLQVVE